MKSSPHHLVVPIIPNLRQKYIIRSCANTKPLKAPTWSTSKSLFAHTIFRSESFTMFRFFADFFVGAWKFNPNVVTCLEFKKKERFQGWTLNFSNRLCRISSTMIQKIVFTRETCGEPRCVQLFIWQSRVPSFTITSFTLLLWPMAFSCFPKAEWEKTTQSHSC